MSTAASATPTAAASPYLLVAFKPLTAMRAILDRGGRQPVAFLVAVAFLSVAIGGGEWGAVELAAERFGWPVAIAIACGFLVLFTAIAMAIFYGFAWFTTHSGRLLGATGTQPDVRAALAWGLMPWIWSLAFRIPAMILWPSASSVVFDPDRESSVRVGDGVFRIHEGAIGDAPFWQIAILTMLQFGVFIWYLWATSRTLSVAQRISPWRAFANLVLALILPAAAMIVALIAAVIANDA